MSKRQFKSQASSARAATGAFGSSFGGATTAASGGFGSSSPLAYISEPLDFSKISDANVVVSFKNLSKRDSTTKTKALEELTTHVGSVGGDIEDGVVDTWVRMYPRTSIDNDRRVRQLAHTLHGQIAAAAGKRFAKQMPLTTGAWLAGSYDSDRSVARAAQDALNRTFPTQEKLQGVRRAYQRSILEYCKDAVEKETPRSLSDERTVSADDSQAKYSRVVAGSLLVIANLLKGLTSEELSKHQELYDNALQSGNIWSFASYDDPAVRRATFNLLRGCLGKRPEILETDLKTISQAFVTKAISSSQNGTSMDYVDCLRALTAQFPSVWTTDYKSKRSPLQALRRFLEKGSQSGSREYWSSLSILIDTLPEEVMQGDLPNFTELLASLHKGITRKDEPRSSLGPAYDAYLHLAAKVSSFLNSEEARGLAKEAVFPIIEHYLLPTDETSQWSIPPSYSLDTAIRSVMTGSTATVVEIEWPRCSNALIENIRISLPETSREFEQSQTRVSEQGKRFAGLQGGCLQKSLPSSLQSIFIQSSSSIAQAALETLSSRNGKPLGAAAILEYLLANDVLPSGSSGHNHISLFVESEIPKIIQSPSSRSLVNILFRFKDAPFFEDVWLRTFRTVMSSPELPEKVATLQYLIDSPSGSSFNLALDNDELQRFALQRTRDALSGTGDWDFTVYTIRHTGTSISVETSQKIFDTILESLAIGSQVLNALAGFKALLRASPGSVRKYLESEKGTQLLPQLLFLVETPHDEIASIASTLSDSIKTLLGSAGPDTSRNVILESIKTALNDTSSQSVSIETLASEVESLSIRSDQTTDQQVQAAALLPDIDVWKQSLGRFLRQNTRASLALTSEIGAITYLLSKDLSEPAESQHTEWDGEGFSLPLRYASYVVKVLRLNHIFDSVADQMKSEILVLIILSTQIANDKLSLSDSNDFWSNDVEEVEKLVVEFISEANDFVRQASRAINSSSPDDEVFGESDNFVAQALKMILDSSRGLSASSYIHARAFGATVSDLIEKNGWQSAKTQELETAVKRFNRSADPAHCAAILSAYSLPLGTSSATLRLCNELIADLMEVDLSEENVPGLQKLILFNISSRILDHESQTIAKQRLIFLIKRMVSWVQDEPMASPIFAEVLRALTVVLPLVKDIYGSHWSDALELLPPFWTRLGMLSSSSPQVDIELVSIHASLKLLSFLRKLTSEDEPNDDLVDSWNDTKSTLPQALLEVAKKVQDVPETHNQPMQMVNDLLVREISVHANTTSYEVTELYPLIFAASPSIQKLAFELLHQQIPSAQEQMSLDAALDKKQVTLPDELLSLVLETPHLQVTGSDIMPLNLRSYLLGWILIFDHFQNASFKVKNDYVENIKKGRFLPPLLDYVTDSLSRYPDKTIAKVNVVAYEQGAYEDESFGHCSLVMHLLFLSMLNVPALVKNWWLDSSRQKSKAVETWAEKYVSPHVMANTLSSVVEWSQGQENNSDDSLLIKVNQRAKEITAAKEVDEQTMSIRIRLPPSYPLAQAQVEGINRVAVDERKWQSWLRIVHGVIAFSNYNVVDGLIAWRKNIVGALKGQSECAICYSIISADNLLPSKRCGTCKNMFHSSCLYKWFKSSNASTCPLCRNPFNYG